MLICVGEIRHSTSSIELFIIRNELYGIKNERAGEATRLGQDAMDDMGLGLWGPLLGNDVLTYF